MWFAEGYVFSRMLAFSQPQTISLAAVYAALAAVAVFLLFRVNRRGDANLSDLARWRALSVAPMAVAVIGSFVSLPLVLLIAALGRLF